ncbi:MAG: hypothetical protein JXM79_04400 [Sedimentisphaerales bacterium]|nr:hypothetical protein [Sedimentisphaerales bacterium]
MKTTGFKAMVIVLAAMLTAGQAYAGWGGGGRRGGGWYGPQLEQGIQGDTEEQGPWMRRGPGREGSETEAWQGGPGRGWNRPDAIGPRGGRKGMGRGLERRFNGPAGPQARFGRGNRPGRGFQGGNIGPRAEMMQRRFGRGRWGQGYQGGRNGRGFRRGADLPDKGGWNGSGRGLQGGNIGPRGRNFEQAPMLRRGPWGNYQGLDSRPGVGLRRGYQDRGFGPQGPGPMMRRGPVEGNQGQGYGPGRGGRGFQRNETPEAQEQGQNFSGPCRMMRRGPVEGNQGQSYGPGRGGRGFQREEVPEAQEQGQNFGEPGRNNRPFPRLRGGRSWEGRPGVRRGPGGPAGRPEIEGSDATPELPTDANNPEEEPPAGEDV